MDKLSHLDDEGRARMVDVSAKKASIALRGRGGASAWRQKRPHSSRPTTSRKATCLRWRRSRAFRPRKAFDLIPLCHTVHIDSIRVKARIENDGVTIESEVVATDKTGVEMEALTAVSVALLTVYDMCKAVDKEMVIGEIVLIEKSKRDV